MKELLTPYISEGLTILVQIAALAVFYGLAILKRKTEAYIAAHTDAKQAELLHLLAREAYAFAETAYRDLAGHEKLSHALDYLEQQAKAKGIPFDADAAKTAIEKAWLETEGIRKRFGG